MYWGILIFIPFLLFGGNEDRLIMEAIFYNKSNDLNNSYLKYKELYKVTKEEIFLIKKAFIALKTEEKEKKEEVLKELEKTTLKENNLFPSKIEIIFNLLTSLEKKDRAVEFLKKASKTEDIKVLKFIFGKLFFNSKYEDSFNVLKKVYYLEPTTSMAFMLVSLMKHLNKPVLERIKVLEDFRKVEKNKNIEMKLISLYRDTLNINGVLESYLILHDLDKENKEYIDTIIGIYSYQNNILSLISFLEKVPSKKELLYEIYREVDKLKAIELANNIYNETKKSKWLGEEGVLYFEIYEKSKNKKDFNTSFKAFEKLISTHIKVDATYLNYYGYILIDLDIDVKKGLKLIKRALNQKPKNIYYVDSLSWGYYKLKECKKADEILEEFNKEKKIEQKEVKEHWLKIKNCLNKEN